MLEHRFAKPYSWASGPVLAPDGGFLVTVVTSDGNSPFGGIGELLRFDESGKLVSNGAKPVSKFRGEPIVSLGVIDVFDDGSLLGVITVGSTTTRPARPSEGCAYGGSEPHTAGAPCNVDMHDYDEYAVKLTSGAAAIDASFRPYPLGSSAFVDPLATAVSTVSPGPEGSVFVSLARGTAPARLIKLGADGLRDERFGASGVIEGPGAVAPSIDNGAMPGSPAAGFGSGAIPAPPVSVAPDAGLPKTDVGIAMLPGSEGIAWCVQQGGSSEIRFLTLTGEPLPGRESPVTVDVSGNCTSITAAPHDDGATVYLLGHPDTDAEPDGAMVEESGGVNFYRVSLVAIPPDGDAIVTATKVKQDEAGPFALAVDTKSRALVTASDVVMRFLPNGKLDTTWDDNGYALVSGKGGCPEPGFVLDGLKSEPSLKLFNGYIGGVTPRADETVLVNATDCGSTLFSIASLRG